MTSLAAATVSRPKKRKLIVLDETYDVESVERISWENEKLMFEVNLRNFYF
jgi:hypothetical protein